jgi:hypothetical protein
MVPHLSEKKGMTMSDEQTYQQRVARRQREEIAALDNPVARRQAELDFYWQCKLDAEAALQADREWVEVGGFLERRRPSCHRSRKDSDWGV